MVTKKNKNIFLLLLCVFFLLIVLYFSLNKIITLEGLENIITPINTTSDSEYCGTSDPYDNNGVKITSHSVMESDSELVSLEKGVPFELNSDDGTRIDFSDVVGSSSPYTFNITTSDNNESDIGLSTGTPTQNSVTGRNARLYTTPLKDSSDSERCNYTYYVEDNL
jgi:hypothetical protein